MPLFHLIEANWVEQGVYLKETPWFLSSTREYDTNVRC